MEAQVETTAQEASHEVLAPERQTLPAIFASPHSGDRYPAHFVAASRLDPLTLRRSEDCFVDEIFGAAPRLGAPLIRALFPRAYVDPNREPFELDPAMFEDPLPSYANTRSPRVAAGLGTIARVVASGAEIYHSKLRFAEALERIRRHYWPYHNSLRALVDDTKRLFGHCLLVDCHSMPSIGGPMERDAGRHRVDIVLGDRHGTACAPRILECARSAFETLGYAVALNRPYSGGFVTAHYGRPAEAVHALQIEINRDLYMDESRIRRGDGLARLTRDMAVVIEAVGRVGGPGPAP